MAIVAFSVIAGEVPTTAKWNIIGTNFDDLETRLSNVSSGHNHDGINSRLVAVNRGFTFTVVGSLITGVISQKYIIPRGLTVTAILVKTTSGSATLRIMKDTTAVEASISASSSVGITTGIDSAALAQSQVLTLEILSVTSGVDLFVTVECSQP